MDKDKYNELYARTFSETQRLRSYSYEEFRKNFLEATNMHKEKIVINEMNPELVELCRIHSLKWGMLGLFVDKSPIFSAMYSTIANDILSIINLLLDGFEYQSYLVLRNLYEVTLTLLVIMLDAKKREAYFETVKRGNDYLIWKKYFTHSKLKETLDLYEQSIVHNGEIDFISEWRTISYREFSRFAHNDMFSLYAYSRSRAKSSGSDEILHSNIWGGILSRTDSVLIDLADILFFTDMTFLKIMGDSNINFTKEDIVSETEDNKEGYNKAIELTFILREYYFDIKKKIEMNEHKK